MDVVGTVVVVVFVVVAAVAGEIGFISGFV